jgi:hypothetical protein
MEQVLEAAWEAGARSAFYHVLRLPWEVAPLFRQWLELHYPQRADRIMARIQEMRGGKDYDADFATRMKGSGTVGRPDRPALPQGGASALGFNRLSEGHHHHGGHVPVEQRLVAQALEAQRHVFGGAAEQGVGRSRRPGRRPARALRAGTARPSRCR